jgi:SEC-C motif-containing protein
MKYCYCKSTLAYSECCEPFLNLKAKISTPLQLMRSRYSAYVLKRIDYLVDTQCSTEDPEILRSEISQFAKRAIFQHLEIIYNDAKTVEFKAYFIADGMQQTLHERSLFVLRNGTWCYKSGEIFPAKATFGRNDPCICGSGKKYKKCCAKKLKQ